MSLVADGRNHYFSCASEIDRELWMRAITKAQNQEKELEENDPIRQKSMKLTGGLKRITIERQKGMGLGCTIKNVGGVIFVNRILEQGTVSSSGVLRPGEFHEDKIIIAHNWSLLKVRSFTLPDSFTIFVLGQVCLFLLRFVYIIFPRLCP